MSHISEREAAALLINATHGATGFQYGVDMDAKTPKGWTPLSYARAKGKYGLCHEKGIYPEDVLKVGFGPLRLLV